MGNHLTQGAQPVAEAGVDRILLRRDNAFTTFDEKATTARVEERLGQFLDCYEAREESRKGKPMIDLVHKEFVKV